MSIGWDFGSEMALVVRGKYYKMKLHSDYTMRNIVNVWRRYCFTFKSGGRSHVKGQQYFNMNFLSHLGYFYLVLNTN